MTVTFSVLSHAKTFLLCRTCVRRGQHIRMRRPLNIMPQFSFFHYSSYLTLFHFLLLQSLTPHFKSFKFASLYLTECPSFKQSHSYRGIHQFLRAFFLSLSLALPHYWWSISVFLFCRKVFLVLCLCYSLENVSLTIRPTSVKRS